MALKFNKKYFLVVESISYLMEHKFLGYHYSVIYKKFHNYSHWGTQETLTVTQETLKRRYSQLLVSAEMKKQTFLTILYRPPPLLLAKMADI